MIPIEPAITSHAFLRAKERLDINSAGFSAWVRSTWREWLRVSSGWLMNRNIRCTDVGTFWYASPWTANRGVALALSNDHAIRTVIDFDQRASLADQVGADELSFASQRLVSDSRLLVQRTGFTGSLFAHGMERAITLFAEGKIDTQDLCDIAQAPKAARESIAAARAARSIRATG